jgi:hypothetical protein
MTHRKQAIVRFLLSFAALGALCSTGRTQNPSKDPSKFDIDGVRLGMGVDEVESALRAHGSTPHIERVQFRSNLGKGPFIGAVVAVTDTDRRKLSTGDHVMVLFTETESNKAWLIERSLTADSDAGTPLDIIGKQAAQKYGNPPPARLPHPAIVYMEFDPNGRLIPEVSTEKEATAPPNMSYTTWDLCEQSPATSALGFLLPSEFDTTVPGYQIGTTGYPPAIPLRAIVSNRCGISLEIRYEWSIKGPGWVGNVAQSLVDNQLEVKDVTNIITINNAAAAQRDEQLRKKAEQQKSPF